MGAMKLCADATVSFKGTVKVSKHILRSQECGWRFHQKKSAQTANDISSKITRTGTAMRGKGFRTQCHSFIVARLVGLHSIRVLPKNLSSLFAYQNSWHAFQTCC